MPLPIAAPMSLISLISRFGAAATAAGLRTPPIAGSTAPRPGVGLIVGCRRLEYPAPEASHAAAPAELAS
jgi:hypothetical protein